MMQDRFPAKIVQTQGLQTMERAPSTREQRQALECITACSDDECIVSSGIHGKPSRLKSRAMKEDLLRDAS